MASQTGSGDYYTSLLERVDDAISAPRSAAAAENPVTSRGADGWQGEVADCAKRVGEVVVFSLNWAYEQATELYKLAKRTYYEQTNRGDDRGFYHRGGTTPFRSDLERSDSIEL